MPRREVEPPYGVRVMLAYFSGLEDPRIDRTKLHPLENIIVMALCGAICGADGWDDFELFAESRTSWFETFLEMPSGTPSADTFRRVFAALDPTEFERRFRAWVRTFAAGLDGQVVAIDGKTLRGAVESASKDSALHLLHIWATEQQVLLAHCAVAGAPGEVQGIPALLQLVDVKGAIVTADANGCTAAVTKAVRERGADYVLALKGNRGLLHEHVAEQFTAAAAHDYHGIEESFTEDVAHGRLEQRIVRALPLGELPASSRAEWVDLRTIVQIERIRTVDGRTSAERQFYISSLPPEPERLAHAVRSHWSVENQLHWCLDVGFDEDASRIRDQQAATNIATIARFALSMIKRESTLKRGVKAKRKNAGWDNSYLLRILSVGIAGL
jgi:predicted transposase YbfD/YdcC